MRAALYWTPEPGDLLAEAGHHWLSRDPEHNIDLPAPNIAGLPDATRAARLYGFHATLRPPMRLRSGWHEFRQATLAMAGAIGPFDLPPLQVADQDGFLALHPTTPCPALPTLAEACLRATEPHRAPPDAAELQKRRAVGLTPRQEALLTRWGYPYVVEEWRFHLTLSRALSEAEMARLRPAAEAHFAAALAQSRRVSSVAIFTQAGPGERFLIAERVALGGKEGLLF